MRLKECPKLQDRLRGKGISTRLMEAIVAHPDVQGLRRWLLATADAHGLYRKFDVTPLSQPERLMERLDRDVYNRTAN